MIHSFQNLLNSGSKNMAVDGHTTPVVFSYTASGLIAVSGLICILRHDGSTPFGNFGTLSRLTNGILIKATLNSVDNTIATVQDNGDLSCMFPRNQFGSSAVAVISLLATPEGFGASNNCFIGLMDFPFKPMLLQNGDSISATVRDNLSSVTYLQVTARLATDQ